VPTEHGGLDAERWLGIMNSFCNLAELALIDKLFFLKISFFITNFLALASQSYACLP
jgi:hypothetical protein